jgi:hypothetical protein
VRFPRKLCATHPAIFLTPLLVVDAQTQAQVALQTLAAPRLTQRGHQRRLWRRFPDRPRDHCDRGRLGAREVSAFISEALVLWEVDSVLADARLRALIGPDTHPWAGGYGRNSFAGGGSRPLGRSRPPPPKADAWASTSQDAAKELTCEEFHYWYQGSRQGGGRCGRG